MRIVNFKLGAIALVYKLINYQAKWYIPFNLFIITLEYFSILKQVSEE